MIEFVAIVLAIIALVRVSRLERELAALRRASLRDVPVRPLAAPAARTTPSVNAAAPAHDTVPPPLTEPVVESAGTMPPVPVGTAESVGDRVPPRRPVPPAPPVPEPSLAEGLERRIGERLLLYAGMLLVLFATAFFLRYAFEHEWMSPTVQVLLGVAGGIAFVAGGRRLARSGFRGYGLFLCGGGFAVLFLSIYAAYGVYALIGQIPAFLAMALTAACAAVLADRESSLALAVMAVCGGFSAPFLVGSVDDSEVTLFTYDAILIAATMYLAARRAWPALNLASFVFTFITVTAWLIDAYTPAQYLTTELFLTLFCGMFVAILRENLRATTAQARIVSAILWTAPVLYHLASVGILYEHGVAFLVYVVFVSAAVVVASLEARSGALRFIGWTAVMLPFAIWVEEHQAAEWTAGTIAVALGTWALFVAPAVQVARRREEIDAWDLRLIHAAGLAVFGIVYVAIDERTSSTVLAGIAAGFAAINASAWVLLRAQTPSAVHFAGVACTLAAVAVAIGFEGYWTVVMWAAEAAALVWVGIRAGRFWFRVAGGVLFAVAIGVWLQSERPEAAGAFLVLLNARALSGLFVIGALHAAGRLLKEVAGSSPVMRSERAVALVAAHALTVVLISLEIVSFWAIRDLSASDTRLARELMLSSAWALYAGALIVVGMQRHYAPIRYFAIALFGLTVAKVFFVDIQQLEGLYRILAFFVTGAVLLLVSYLYARSTRTGAR